MKYHFSQIFKSNLSNNILIKKLFLFTIFLFLLSNENIFAQSRLRISIITVSPGNDISSTFGHSAIRIIDSNSVSDIIYNYGTFPFYEDGFIFKFMLGKANYFVETNDFYDFIEEYRPEKRGVVEQVLKLNSNEKDSIRAFLNKNCEPQNKFYKYDFFFDNCTTRLRDILKKNHDSNFCKISVMAIGTTFRNAIHFYLDKNKQSWNKLGIDLLLGKKCDAKMTIEQMEFLPENLMYCLDSTAKTNLISKSIILPNTRKIEASFISPNKVFWGILLFSFLLLTINFYNKKLARPIIKFFDFLLFFTSGIVGFLLLFMWFITDHNMCRDNFNLIWALPTNLFFSFILFSESKIKLKYFKLVSILMFLLLTFWYFLPQNLNNSLIPFVILLLIKSRKYSLK